MRRGTSITARLTLLFAAVSTAVLLALGMLIGNAVERHFVEQDMDVLNGKTQLAANLLAQVRLPGDSGVLLRQLDDSLVGHHELAVVILDGTAALIWDCLDGATTEQIVRDVLR